MAWHTIVIKVILFIIVCFITLGQPLQFGHNIYAYDKGYAIRAYEGIMKTHFKWSVTMLLKPCAFY